MRLWEKKERYQICIKSDCYNDIKHRCDTKWREYIKIPDNVNPSWRLSGGFQWRTLHCVLATNKFVSKFNLNVSPLCMFCSESETVFHVFIECSRLIPLFALLGRVLENLGYLFNKVFFYLWM